MIAIGVNAPRWRWHVESHHHPHYEMIVVTGGHEDVAVQEKRIQARTGDVLLFKPGIAHKEWSDVDDPLQTFYITFQTECDTSIWPLQTSDEQGRIRLLSTWLFSGRDSLLPETRAAEDAFFQSLISEFIRLQCRQDDPLVEGVRSFVRKNIGAALTVDMLAQHAGISKFHFIRHYRRLTGRTPMEDVRMIRVGHARDMILTSNLPLKAIAPMCGLGDEISLYRLFRRYLNLTPGQLRRKAKRH